MKVSCVMATYGRFKTVERSLSMFFQQDYADKELIIFNTAAHKPLESDLPITIINNEVDYQTGEEYTSLGAIRRDALTHATGDIYVCWDDDDLFAANHLSRGIEKLQECKKSAWKPHKSLFTNDAGKTFSWESNSFEASILVKKEKVFFEKGTGDEHLVWFTKLISEDDIKIEDVSPLSYCYYWGDGLHKTSGDIYTPGNFDTHKAVESDFGDRPLEIVDVSEVTAVFHQPIAFVDLKKQKEYNKSYFK